MYVDQGRDVTRLEHFEFDNADLAYRHFALVSVDRDSDGTTITWDPACAPQASIDRVIDMLHTLAAPLHLRFYVHGWITERYRTAAAARRRIEQATGLAHVSFLSEFFARPRPVADMARLRALREGGAVEDQLARFTADDGLPVYSVGPRSLLARTFGPEWLRDSRQSRLHGCASNGALTGSARAYHAVAASGNPVFDRAVVRAWIPGKEPRWIAYDRAIWVELNAGREMLVNLCVECRDGPLLFSQQ